MKGLSALFNLANFDVVKGVPVDYMHCVLEGTVRLLMQLWFEGKHSSKAFSLRKHLLVISSIFEAQKPPNFVARLPSSISKYKEWKGMNLVCRVNYYIGQ